MVEGGEGDQHEQWIVTRSRVHPDDVIKVEDAQSATIKTGKPRTIECRGIRHGKVVNLTVHFEIYHCMEDGSECCRRRGSTCGVLVVRLEPHGGPAELARPNPAGPSSPAG